MSVVDEDAVLVGSIIADRYLVQEVLGQGTTGTVFRVENIHFGRPAALKVLRPKYVSLDAIQRVFHGEAQTAWSINHACLVEVFDVGKLPDGSPFFVMELLQGETLAARIAREPLSLSGAIDIVMQILAAIDVIHTRGLLLRDLRPQNVVLAERRGCRPLVKITDFGLSRLVPLEQIREEWEAQRSGGVAHSVASGSLTIPYYLSPERARSEHGVEPASDVFLAAVHLYEALTRVKPFVSTTFDGFLKVQQGRPQPLTALRPDLPAGLDAVVLRALASDPRARPQSAMELQDALRAVYDGSRTATAPRPKAAAPVPIPAPPPRAPQKPIGGDDLYLEETETLRQPVAKPRSPVVDEASAASPNRTLPAPAAEAENADASIDVHFEANEASHHDRTRPGEKVNRRRLVGEDEETETMDFTPELRQRIDEMQKLEGAANSGAAPKDDRLRKKGR